MIRALRTLAVAIAVVVSVSACASDDAGSTEYRGFIVIDASGSQLCDALAESYPPQCAGLIVTLADLQPDTVVALQSPDDPSLGSVSWTDYRAGVTGEESDGVLSNVVLTDPIASGQSAGLIVRVADLGFVEDDPFTLPIDVRNATDDDMVLTFGSGQRVEFTLSNDSGEVYRWSSDLVFTQAIESVDLPAGSIFGATLTGELTGVSPGTYEAAAWVTALETRDVVVTWQTTVR